MEGPGGEYDLGRACLLFGAWTTSACFPVFRHDCGVALFSALTHRCHTVAFVALNSAKLFMCRRTPRPSWGCQARCRMEGLLFSRPMRE